MAGREALAGVQTLGISHQAVEQGLVERLEAAVALDDREAAEELLGTIAAVPAGRRPPFLEATCTDSAGDSTASRRGWRRRQLRFREIGIPFWRAVTLLEHGELTGDTDSLDAAREIFEGLKAKPWLERVDGVHKIRPEVLA